MSTIITRKDVETAKIKIKRGEVKQALQTLENKLGGLLTPRDVLEEARDAHSPLHHNFEWNDDVGAEKYRLMQARLLINSIKVEYLGRDEDAYHNVSVQVNDVPVRAYFPIERVMSDKDLRNELLRQALRDIESANRRYGSLKELVGVIDEKRLAEVKKAIES